MKYTYDRKEGNNTILIYFTGWGTTPEVVAHLARPSDWDYFATWDFRNVTHGELPIFPAYEQIYLVGWSMGVWAADRLASYLPTPNIALAVNGTPLPMHDDYGIPRQIFKGTLNGLDDYNRDRFNRRMCGGKKLLSVFNSFSTRSTEDLREELMGVYDEVRQLTEVVPPAMNWTNAIVGTKDLIIPVTNQINYWEQWQVPVEQLDGLGHYPFMEYSTWGELLGLVNGQHGR